MNSYRVLNSRVARVDAVEKVVGKAVYTDDMVVSGMLYGAILHSPVAHARILSIDTSLAKALPGVKAVLTHADTGHVKFGVSPARYDETIFCEDKVRYVGDEVAAVAATDPGTAMKALDLIKVVYEPLPILLDGLRAMEPGAPKVHERFHRNICQEVHWHFGDVDAARAQADFVRTDSLSSKMQDGAFLEPQSALAQYDHNGYLTLYSSTQTTHYVHRTLAMVLDIPLHKVRVVKPYVGGGFGPKAACSSMELITALLAMKTGRPVKITFDREQVFLHSRARHQFFHKMTTGIRRDGTISFLEHHCIMDGGAYSSFGIASVYYAGSLLGGPYRLANMKYDGYRVFTNKPVSGAQRGHGAVIARALFEVQLDRLAEEIGMDPLELRLKNVMETGDTTCNELDMSSLGMRECLEAVRERTGWNSRRTKGSSHKADGHGMGVAAGFFVSGAGYPIYRSRTHHCTVEIKVAEVGGGVTVRSGAAEIGQGSDTMLAMITAEVLGIPMEDVKVLSGDSDLSVDLGAYSSRTTLMTGHATRQAAMDARKQILEVLAEKTGIPLDALDIRDGFVHVQGSQMDFASIRKEYLGEHRGFPTQPHGDLLTFAEASRLAFLERGSIIGKGSYRPPPLGGSFKGAAVGTSPAFGCSAQVAELNVDMETGQIHMERITGAHDCGFAINRTQVEAQMQGAMSMGLGEALMEEVKYDDQGRILNANLAEYKIPTAMDMPPLESIIVESHEPNGPFGAKEVGEGAIMPTIPAVLNALYDATGAMVTELPLTPERVLRAIKKARGETSRGDGDTREQV